MKVKNEKYANRTLNSAYGEIQFNDEGIAEIQPDETAEEFLALTGFSRADGEAESSQSEPDKEKEDENAGDSDDNQPDAADNQDSPESSPSEEENQQDEPAGAVEEEIQPDETAEEKSPTEQLQEKLNKMNVPQLKKYAKEQNIDLGSASKKDEIIPVILGATSAV